MASLRKKLSMVLGFNADGSPSTSKANSMDVKRSSMDSGYHSMIAKSKRGSQDSLRQVTTFTTLGTERSPERSPEKLHKKISTTFSGAMQAFSNTVRSTTSYIYPTASEPELPSSEWAECETPKKESRRSSIMSSVRSQKRKFVSRVPGANVDPFEMPQSAVPVPATQEQAPALDVEIPNPSFSYEPLEQVPISSGSQLLAGVKLPTGPKNLWPAPTRLTVDQASGSDRQVILDPVSPNLDDPYVEQGDRFQDGYFITTSSSEFVLESLSPETNEHNMGDDKGYFSEVESNADVSEINGPSPACLEYVAPGSPESRISSPCCLKDPTTSQVDVASSTSPYKGTIPSWMSSSELSQSETPYGIAEPRESLELPCQITSLEDCVNALSSPCEAVVTSKPRTQSRRLPSDVYDADAESLELSMGSRATWERHRADRERRYMEIVDMAPDTEPDVKVESELELKRSPSKKPVHYAEDLVQGTVSTGRSEKPFRYSTDPLRSAVEAIDRPASPVGDLAYAVEAIERPSITTFDPLETVFEQRPFLRLIDTIDEPVTLQNSDVLDLSPSCVEVPSSSLADRSPSRVELPSSPESFPVSIPASLKSTMMSTRPTDKKPMALGEGDLDDQSIRRFSSESTDASANSSPEKLSHTLPEDACEADLEDGDLVVSTYLSSSSKTDSVGEDAYQAGLGAAGISMPRCPSDEVQRRPMMESSQILTPIFKETSCCTYREKLEAGSSLLKQQSRNSSLLGNSRTVSALSSITDDSCAITTRSPSCIAPPPFPSLHIRSKPARRIPSAIDALATHGDEQIHITGPANCGFDPSLPSPFDGPEDQTDEAGSKLFSSEVLEGADTPEKQASPLEQHDLQSPSPCTTNSIQSPSNSNDLQETFNAAELPTFVSPSLIASNKSRRKQKKSSSGIETSSYGQLGGRNQQSKDHASLEELTEIVGGSVRCLDPTSKSKSSKKSSCKGQVAATLPVVSSPQRKRMPGARGERSSAEPYLKAESDNEDSQSRFEPEFNINQFDSMSESLPWYGDRRAGSTSYAGYELDSVLSASSPEPSWHHQDEDLQSDSGDSWGHPDFIEYPDINSEYFQRDFQKEWVHPASTDLIIGNDSDTDTNKDASCVPGPKKNGKSPREAKKRLAMQRELEDKSDHTCSRLIGKLRSGTPGDDHVHEDDLAHKGRRSPWRN